MKDWILRTNELHTDLSGILFLMVSFDWCKCDAKEVRLGYSVETSLVCTPQSSINLGKP